MFDLLLKAMSRIVVSYSAKKQAVHFLPDFNAWGLDRNGDQLVISGISALELIKQYGSPLLVLNELRLDYDIRNLQKAFSCAPRGSMILYSYKTNCIPGILQYIHSRGLGAEVISPYELRLAERLCVPGNNIIFNGVSKSKESLEQAIKKGVFSINADTIDELETLKDLSAELKTQVRIGLRLGLAGDSQFGLDFDSGEAAAACGLVMNNMKAFNLVVIHLHTVANARNAKKHLAYIKKALKFLLQIKNCYGVDVPYLDIGGGYGVPTSQVMSKPAYAIYRLLGILPSRPNWNEYQPMADYFKEVVKFISDFCNTNRLPMPKLIIEPGRVVTSRAELLLSSVNATKKKNSGLQFAMTDVGKHSIAYPCDYEYHDIFVANKLTRLPFQRYNIVGRICMSSDFIVKNKLLPQLEPSDVIAVMDAGAYFSSYSSNFGFPRPAIIKVCEGKTDILRHEETLEHTIYMDTVFPR